MKRIDALREPRERVVEEMRAVVLGGGTVIFPTDTVYGIGCDPLRLEAVERIFALKGRPANKPLSLHFGSVEELLEYVPDNEAVASVARGFLPGPLTVLVPRPACIDARVNSGLPTIGMRVPDHDLCRALLEACGPLAATSANLSGEPAFTGEAAERLPEADLFVDAGPTPLGVESTVADFSGGELRVIREGAISIEILQRHLRRVAGALVLALALSRVSTVLADPGFDRMGGFNIDADTVDYNYASGEYRIPTRFFADNGKTDLTADRAHGNTKQKLLYADGSVVVHRKEHHSTLTCDHLVAEGKAGTYTATGHVHFVEGDRDATAERGIFDDHSNHLLLSGSVRIQDTGRTLLADHVDYDTHTGEGVAGGNVTVLAPVPTPSTAPGSARARAHGRRR